MASDWSHSTKCQLFLLVHKTTVPFTAFFATSFAKKSAGRTTFNFYISQNHIDQNFVAFQFKLLALLRKNLFPVESREWQHHWM